MKLTLSWLKEYLETSASTEQIAEKLTAIGLEVENVVDHSKSLEPFTIAYVESTKPHPNADRLKICTVDDGQKKYQIICGAPNARAGIKVVLSLPGMVIPATGQVLKQGNIRGVESQGMLCAIDELGLGPETTGIIELPADAPIGAPYAKTYGLDDAVIEINLTPNRADCAGIYGIARDLAAAGLGQLKPISYPKIDGTFAPPVTVRIDTPNCPQFALRVIRGVKNGPSPDWLQQKLKSVGLRPISTLVDITNYFTIAFARPMHVFDAKKLRGNLRVYAANGGEELVALNDKTYRLEAGMTVVGDDSGVLSVGGIVGGVSSGVDENTTDVVLEVALWNPDEIARVGRKLECITDARYRFERGVDPEFVTPALNLASQMILDLCGGVASSSIIAGKTPDWQRKIPFRPERVKTLGGVELPEKQIYGLLQSLGFVIGNDGVAPPSWRGDVLGEADLVEEVIRIHGLDNVPAATLPMVKIPVGVALNPLQKRVQLARRALAGRGILESLSFAFVSRAQSVLFGGGADELRLLNPISSDLDYMRPSILPSLLTALQFNAARAMGDLAIFEIGAQYAGVKPEQQSTAAAILRSGKSPRQWMQKQSAVDPFMAKSDAMELLRELGVDPAKVQIAADGAPSYYHPGQSGVIKQGPNVMAYFGAMHPSVLAHYDIKLPVVAAEVFLDKIPAAKSKSSKTKPLLQLPELLPVERDFAFVVDESVSADAVMRAAREADKQLIVGASLFDVFTGGNLGAGKKSLAISVVLQPREKTLTDAEIEAAAQKIIASVQAATGAVLRG